MKTDEEIKRSNIKELKKACDKYGMVYLEDKEKGTIGAKNFFHLINNEEMGATIFSVPYNYQDEIDAKMDLDSMCRYFMMMSTRAIVIDLFKKPKAYDTLDDKRVVIIADKPSDVVVLNPEEFSEFAKHGDLKKVEEES